MNPLVAQKTRSIEITGTDLLRRVRSKPGHEPDYDGKLAGGCTGGQLRTTPTYKAGTNLSEPIEAPTAFDLRRA